MASSGRYRSSSCLLNFQPKIKEINQTKESGYISPLKWYQGLWLNNIGKNAFWGKGDRMIPFIVCFAVKVTPHFSHLHVVCKAEIIAPVIQSNNPPFLYIS